MFWFCGDRWSRRLLSKSCFHIYWNSQSEKSPPAASGLPSGLEAAVPASSSQNLLWCLNLLSCWKRRRAKSFIFNFSFSISMFLLRAHAAFRSRGTRWGWLSINRKLLNNILSHFCKTKITKWSWFNWLVEKKLYSLINNLNIHLIPMRLKSWTVISPPPPVVPERSIRPSLWASNICVPWIQTLRLRGVSGACEAELGAQQPCKEAQTVLDWTTTWFHVLYRCSHVFLLLLLRVFLLRRWRGHVMVGSRDRVGFFKGHSTVFTRRTNRLSHSF